MIFTKLTFKISFLFYLLVYLIFTTNLSSGITSILWTVKKSDIVDKRVFRGELKAKNSIVIYAPNVSWKHGDVLSIKYVPDDGTKVKKGDVVLTFETSQMEQKYIEAKSEYNVALADLKQEESQLALEKSQLALELEIARMMYEKAKLSIIEGDISSEIKRKQAELDAESKLNEYNLIKKKVSQFKDKYDSRIRVKKINLEMKERDMNDIKNILDSLVVRAPADGTIYRPFTTLNWEKCKAERGKMVQSSDLVLEIPDMNSFNIVMYTHPQDVQNLKVSDEMESTFTAFPGLKVRGKVESIGSYITTLNERLGTKTQEGNVQEVELRGSLNEQFPEKFRPSMTTKTMIKSVIAQNVLTIPVSALIKENGDYFVRMKDESKRMVNIGKGSNHFVEVTGGVKEGESIIY